MKVTFFIDRPVFSAVISIVIVIVGIIGLTMLPVDQYPQITPPVVKISASYPGASALTVSQAVATPIEQEIMVRRVCFIWNQTVLTPEVFRQRSLLMYLLIRIWQPLRFRTV